MLYVGYKILGILILLCRLSVRQHPPETPALCPAARREHGCASGFELSCGEAPSYPCPGRKKNRGRSRALASTVLCGHLTASSKQGLSKGL